MVELRQPPSSLLPQNSLLHISLCVSVFRLQCGLSSFVLALPVHGLWMGVRGEYKHRAKKKDLLLFTFYLCPTLSYSLTLCLSSITLITLLTGSCNAPLSQVSWALWPTIPQSCPTSSPSYCFRLRSRLLIAHHGPAGNKMDCGDLYLKTGKSYVHLPLMKIKNQIHFFLWVSKI